VVVVQALGSRLWALGSRLQSWLAMLSEEKAGLAPGWTGGAPVPTRANPAEPSLDLTGHGRWYLEQLVTDRRQFQSSPPPKTLVRLVGLRKDTLDAAMDCRRGHASLVSNLLVRSRTCQ
jgi:hypothetical protein